MPEPLPRQSVVAMPLTKADEDAAASVGILVEAARRPQHCPVAQIMLGHPPRCGGRIEPVGHMFVRPFFASEPFVPWHECWTGRAKVLPGLEYKLDAIPQRRRPFQSAPEREVHES